MTADELERAAKVLSPHPLGDQNKLIAICEGLATLLQHLADCERGEALKPLPKGKYSGRIDTIDGGFVLSVEKKEES